MPAPPCCVPRPDVRPPFAGARDHRPAARPSALAATSSDRAVHPPAQAGAPAPRAGRPQPSVGPGSPGLPGGRTRPFPTSRPHRAPAAPRWRTADSSAAPLPLPILPRKGVRYAAKRDRPQPRAVRPITRMQSASRPPVASLPCARPRHPGEVAQLVEHTTENRGVVGSIPTLAIRRCAIPGGLALNGDNRQMLTVAVTGPTGESASPSSRRWSGCRRWAG